MVEKSVRSTGGGPSRSFPAGRSEPQVRRLHYRDIGTLDLYHSLLTIGWTGFFGLIALAYAVFNVCFALLYLLAGGIANARPGAFADAFFFSVQTMATIGYGQMYPQSLAANVLVSVEVLLGMSGLALATGLIFARFSRPTARVIFSHVAVVAPYDGVPTLMFRAANQRRNQIIEAQVNVSLLRDERSGEGHDMRRFHDLRLLRARTPMFSLTWTVMHPIDRDSPLYGCTPESLRGSTAEIVVTLIGIDGTFAQTVHARHTYAAGEIVWNRRFVEILSRAEDGARVVDYRHFHELSETRE